MWSLWKTEEKKFTPGSNIASLKAQESRGESLDNLGVHTHAQGCSKSPQEHIAFFFWKDIIFTDIKDI